MHIDLVNQARTGRLYKSNTFLIPVLEGTWFEMGEQYGALMAEHMQTTWDVLAKAGVESGAISQDDVTTWANRS